MNVNGAMLIVGGSRGIGHAAAEYYASRVERLWCVSRTPSPHGEWIGADLASPVGVSTVVERLADERLDALLYLGGTWEVGAFTSAYDFAASAPWEVDYVLAVNLLAPIKLVHGLLPALRRSDKPRCLFIGSLSGIENAASREVANSASKYGLRGAVHALRRELPDIGFTVVNPGNIATAEVVSDVEAGRFGPQTLIPLNDLLAVINLALSLSPAAVASEINLAQMRGDLANN